MREQFEEWFKSTKSYQMLMGMNYFKKDLFHFIDGRGEYCHSSVQIAFMTWQACQAEIDHLNSVLDERTKEWLKAIELGDYFKNVAKPLKAELDQKDAQIKELEAKRKSLKYLFDSLISECELWGYESDQSDRAIVLLKQALVGDQ